MGPMYSLTEKVINRFSSYRTLRLKMYKTPTPLYQLINRVYDTENRLTFSYFQIHNLH